MTESDKLIPPIGTASFTSKNVGYEKQRIRLNTTGRCVEETLQSMARGDRGKPMPRAALESIRTQAADILEAIIDAYAVNVAEDEVGAEGRAKASTAPARVKCPTGLLYGRVQSGKTAAMIVTCALAIDNGFRVIVVLTSNNVKLVEQTKDRFGDLHGALINSSLNSVNRSNEWDRNKGIIRTFLPTRGAVFVCAKEDGHLESLIRFLQSIDAADYPALILDDEADHATPDTRESQRARGKSAFSSTTFRLVVENNDPQQPGLSLRETLRHNVFLQVTATPYGLLLQNLTNPLRPAFTHLLVPGDGYTGGEAFFARTPDPAEPPLVYIDEQEGSLFSDRDGRAPEGLQRALAFFLIAASAHKQVTGLPPRRGYKFLCHTSAKREVHRQLESLIKAYVDDLALDVSVNGASALNRPEVVWAIAEISRGLKATLDLPSLLKELDENLPRRSLQVVNSEVQGEQLRFDQRYNFIVGGNILGRGLTIDDLLVTYYLRQARVTQMDTMHQHARMYGYRNDLMPFTRVFLTPTLAARFRQIHESESTLRDLLDGNNTGRAIPVEVAGNLKPTRSNILDIGALSAYRPGQQVYPVEPVHDPRELGGSVAQIERMITDAFGGIITVNEYRQVSLHEIARIIKTVCVQEDDGEWNTDAILNVLEATASKYASQAYLYVREFRRTSVHLTQGAVSGKEQEDARLLNAPTLFMFRGLKGSPWKSDIWYPTMVFPPSMPAVVFNRDPR